MVAKSQKAQPKPVESGSPKAVKPIFNYPKIGISAIGEQVSKHFGEHGTYVGTVVAVSPNSLECLCLSDGMYACQYKDETYTIRFPDGVRFKPNIPSCLKPRPLSILHYQVHGRR